MPPNCNNTGVNGIFGFSARLFQCMLLAFWSAFLNQRELSLDLWLKIEETTPFNNLLPLWVVDPKIGVIGAPGPSVAFLLEGSVVTLTHCEIENTSSCTQNRKWKWTRLAISMRYRIVTKMSHTGYTSLGREREGVALAPVDGRLSQIIPYMHHVNYVSMCRFGRKIPSGVA